ncbi:MAG TPA: ArsA family ATPase, partial [Pseudomonas pachastrellae]|nr:ArsA family ATPase [Halopseudomonas pachastrellae]
MSTDLSNLLERRLIWVGGKGGVGKTSVSAALAVLAAQRGKRCLVVSTDPAHSLGDVFARALDDSPRRLLPNLDAMEIDPDAEVDAHLARVIDQMRKLAAPEMLQELTRQMQLTRHSPGTQEAALLERIARLVTAPPDDYDLIIFDTAPTGHTLRLLTLPEAMAAWTDGLLSHNRKSAELSKVLQHLTPRSGRD